MKISYNLRYWLVLILSIYSSFALVGGIYFFPKGELINISLKGATIQGLSIFLLLSLLCFIAFLKLIDYLGKASFSQEEERSQSQKTIFFIQSMLLIFTIGLVYWVLHFPGNTFPDTNSVSLMINRTSYTDYHTVILPLLYKFLLFFWYSPAVISLFQIITFAWICALWMSFFYEQGLSKKLLFLIFGIFYALPVNGSYAVSLLKDIQYTQSLLLLSYLFLKFFINKNYQKSNVFLIYLGIAMALPLLFRHVGFFVFSLSILMLFLHSFLKKTWNTFFIPFSIAVVCILSVEVGLRKAFHFQHNIAGNKNSLIVMPINTAYIYNQSASLSQVIKDELILEDSEDYWKNTGSTSINDIYWTSTDSRHLVFISQKLENSKDFIRYYYHLWKDSPIIHFRTRLNLIDPLWNANGTVLMQSSVNWIPFEGYPYEKTLSNFIAPFTLIANISGFILPIWLSTIILLFLAGYFYLYDDKRKLVILAGWFANGVGLFITSPSTDYRYFWIGTWLAVIGMLLVVTKSLKSDGQKR